MSSSTFTPEYIAQDSKGASLAKMTACMVLAMFIVGLRFGVQFYRKIHFALDDWLILVSLAFTWGLYAVCILEYRYGGLGKHILVLDETDPQAIVNMETYFFIADYLYATTLATFKWSVLVMYFRIFPTRFMKWSMISLCSIVTSWWLACIFVSTFGCKPIRKAWDPFIPGVCVDHVKVFIGKAIPNFTADFLILFLPAVEIFKLRMKIPQKIALGGVFLLGALACASSIVRFKVIMGLSQQNADATYILPDIMVWTIVEPCAGIISACLPRLRPLLTIILDRSRFMRLSSNKVNNIPKPPDIITFGGRGGGSGRKKSTDKTSTTLIIMGNDDTTVESSAGRFDGNASRGSDTAISLTDRG